MVMHIVQMDSARRQGDEMDDPRSREMDMELVIPRIIW
jgi:hypothetical protein